MNIEAIANCIKDNDLKYAWINTYDELKIVDLCEWETDDIKKAKIKELEGRLIEAKFFNNDFELSIYVEDGQCKEYMFKHEEHTDGAYKEFQELEKHKKLCKDETPQFLILKHFIKYDEDGQAYVGYTKMCDVSERGPEDEC